MLNFKQPWVMIGIFGGFLLLVEPAVASRSTADHSQFKRLQQRFESGPEVTAVCLECHTEAATQIHQSIHWSWQHQMPDGDIVGKTNVLNNFCVGLTSNEPRCTSCHVGYGYKDASFDFSSKKNVDCLVCHDTTGSYKKFPVDAGHPNYVPKEWPKGSGKIRPAVALTNVAQNVGIPDRDNCGSCHFYGGGGDAVKHGDLDSSMFNPSFDLDVHMSPDGQNFVCQDCHTQDSHVLDGSRYEPTAVDLSGIDVPGHTDGGRATCESCHGNAPHDGEMAKRLNHHTETLACQTCHIPEFARELATKTWWDWSTAGRKDESGKLITVKDEQGRVTYTSKKGDFIWRDNVEPEYFWFNGQMDYTTVGERVEPQDGVLALTKIGGDALDPEAKIWPFKVMRGKQPYDPVNQLVITPHLFGKDKAAYWKSYNWITASAAGQKASGMPFSGEVEFIETLYHWPINHMVAPAEKALACESCHSNNGRLNKLAGFYLPGRVHDSWVDRIGWGLVIASFFGVTLHAVGRAVAAYRRR